jgi:hypothetical protein
MIMDEKLTKELQQWLNTPAEERDIETGARLVRVIVRNQILAGNFQRLPKKYMKMVEYQLNKRLPMRLAGVTHEDMVRMTRKVTVITAERGLNAPLPGKDKAPVLKRIEKTEDFKLGKRPDHDRLPEEIQALYAENLSLMQNMRACHAQLVLLTLPENQSNCPDGDRYPFVKEIIELDARYHANWEKYDTYPPVDDEQ